MWWKRTGVPALVNWDTKNTYEIRRYDLCFSSLCSVVDTIRLLIRTSVLLTRALVVMLSPYMQQCWKETAHLRSRFVVYSSHWAPIYPSKPLVKAIRKLLVLSSVSSYLIRSIVLIAVVPSSLVLTSRHGNHAALIKRFLIVYCVPIDRLRITHRMYLLPRINDRTARSPRAWPPNYSSCSSRAAAAAGSSLYVSIMNIMNIYL